MSNTPNNDYDEDEEYLSQSTGQQPGLTQTQYLNQAKEEVDKQAYRMKRSLDKGNLDDALKYAASMLNELRTSNLSPKNYYILYMQVFDHLRHLELYFREEHDIRGRKMQELYELVQHTGNIVPRLYLLVTVGSVYIQTKEAPAKEILKDLVEMCKGVQHPTRGLFLRNYLSQLTKDKLPDTGSEYESVGGGNVNDSIAYVLQNFHEMVFLFSRLKNEGPVKERAKREKERLDLRILIATNLVRLSQLDGISLELYKNEVLPKVLQIIIRSNDQMAQQYLMESLIQVFPDDFHIATLSQILAACHELQTDVDLKTIYIALMDRLANYARQYPEGIPQLTEKAKQDDSNTQQVSQNIIDIFISYIERISIKRMEIADILSVQISLMSLALQTYPEKVNYVNDVITFCSEQLKTTNDISSNQTLIRLIKRLLLTPIEIYKNILTILDLESFGEVLSLLAFEDRRYVALELCQCGIKYRTVISTWEEVGKLFELIRPLLKDEEDMVERDDEEFEEEQNTVARLIHLFYNEDTDVMFKVLATARKQFGQGGVKRIQYTLSPLVFAYLSLAKRIHNSADKEEKAIQEEKVFQYVIEILDVLANQQSSMALRLYLQSAICADQCKLETLVYELLSQAFMLYEEEDSKIQLDFLILIINTMRQLKNIGEENYDTLSTKTCQYSAKLLRKPDQCKAACMCSNLFWPMPEDSKLQNASKALECLQWSLKIVKACMPDQQIPLFVEILNLYLYQFHTENEKVTADYLNGLIDLINSNIDNVDEEVQENEAVTIPIKIFYKNTINYIRYLKRQQAEKYADVMNL
ncbi:hypothetical protein ABK040_008805 [Willaertia magna]